MVKAPHRGFEKSAKITQASGPRVEQSKCFLGGGLCSASASLLVCSFVNFGLHHYQPTQWLLTHSTHLCQHLSTYAHCLFRLLFFLSIMSFAIRLSPAARLLLNWSKLRSSWAAGVLPIILLLSARYHMRFQREIFFMFSCYGFIKYKRRSPPKFRSRDLSGGGRRWSPDLQTPDSQCWRFRTNVWYVWASCRLNCRSSSRIP